MSSRLHLLLNFSPALLDPVRLILRISLSSELTNIKIDLQIETVFCLLSCGTMVVKKGYDIYSCERSILVDSKDLQATDHHRTQLRNIITALLNQNVFLCLTFWKQIR